ncbi:hypothetical protein K439DRAFT_1649736 [Ramaria rubella]|nr:hypothetical protein K439DRAFT_1649736 [Ramaria rubella]
MISTVVKKTRGNWGAGILRFNQYCDSIGVPEEGRMPAPEILLCLFVANYGAGSVSNDCINGWLAGLHRWHQVNDTPWFGASRLVPEESRQPAHPPVTIEHIECLRAHLDLSNTFDSAVFAIATIAFYGYCRLGELTIPSRRAFNPSFHITRNCNIVWGVTRHASPCIPPNTPLFAWCKATKGWEPMTKEWFMNRCNDIFREHNLQTMDGHSFRIRGMTWLLLLGMNPWIIKVIGRWSSPAFLVYWCKIERILTDFISDTYQAVHTLSSHMSHFVLNL